MRRILAAAALLPLTAVSPPSARGPLSHAEAAPNILVIVTDDQRLGTVTPLPEIRRRFRAEGVEYPNATASTPVCCPSRASIMSGRYAHNHGVHDNHQADAFDEAGSVQRYLHEAGYRTGILGKFLNGWDLERNPAYLDDWAIFTSSSNYHRSTWNVNGTVRSVPEYSTTFLRHRVVRYLEESEASDDAPWFLLVAPAAPHAPAQAEDRYRHVPFPAWPGNPATREADRSDKPPYLQARPAARPLAGVMRRQLRTLLSVDLLVATVFDRLEELGEQDTLALFLSDNGFLLGEHGWTGKGVPYRASIGIPFFLRWPGRIAGGTSDDALVGTIDVAPTVLDAAGLGQATLETEMDGRSLLGPIERDAMLSEFWTAGGPVPTWASIRTPAAQYVEYEVEPGLVTFREYYDLVSDPWQLTNLLGDDDPTNDPPDVADLAARLAALRRCAGTTGPAGCS
ncbi:MAG TPA: sulfatase [Actinomycetota bacterium]